MQEKAYTLGKIILSEMLIMANGKKADCICLCVCVLVRVCVYLSLPLSSGFKDSRTHNLSFMFSAMFLVIKKKKKNIRHRVSAELVFVE